MKNDDPIRILHIARMKKGSGVASFLMNYYRNIDRTRVQFDFLSDGNEWETFENEIKSMGGKLYKVPNYKKHFFSFVFLVTKIIDRKKYAVIHTHELAYNLLVLGIARIKGISHRYSHSHSNIQDDNFSSRIKILFIASTRFLYGFLATKRFACSGRAGEFLYGGLSFEIIPNAIKAVNFAYSREKREKIRKELLLADDTVLIGYVAGFTKQKNHSYLIEILELLTGKNKNIKLVLIGYGIEMENIQKLAAQKKCSDLVIFYGKSEKVEDLYSAMDVFVFPSLGEGLGIAGIEAQANGLPVLASTNVPPEIEVSGLASRIDLKEGREFWAEKILEILPKRTTADMSGTITAAGYNIDEEAKKLTEFYCGLEINS